MTESQLIQRDQEAQLERFHPELWGWWVLLVVALALLWKAVGEWHGEEMRQSWDNWKRFVCAFAEWLSGRR